MEWPWKKKPQAEAEKPKPDYSVEIGGFRAELFDEKSGVAFVLTPNEQTQAHLDTKRDTLGRNEEERLKAFLRGHLQWQLGQANRDSRFTTFPAFNDLPERMVFQDAAQLSMAPVKTLPQAGMDDIAKALGVIAGKYKTLDALREGYDIQELAHGADRESSAMMREERAAKKRAQPFIQAAMESLDAHHAQNPIAELDELKKALSQALGKAAEQSPSKG